MTYVLLLLAVALLVGLNGFFVAAEFALVRSRRSKLEQMEEEGDRKAGRVLRQMDDMNAYLAACQLGITLASIAIGFLGEPAIAQLLESAFGDSIPHSLSLVISITLAYLITTAAHITVGEQVPKIHAIVRPETVARRVARPLHFFYVVFRPGVSMLNSVSNGILRAVGINPQAELEEASSAEDLKLLIAQSAHGGVLDPSGHLGGGIGIGG